MKMKVMKILFLFAVLSISSCTRYEESDSIPKPSISFYEGRDYWNNPIYIRSDTTVTGKKTRAIMAHFASAAGIRKISIKLNGSDVINMEEDNETKFNEELSCPITPETLPSTFVATFKVEDWEDNVVERSITVNFK